MIRESATVVETPVGRFGVDIFESDVQQHGESLGPSFYAETESGTFVVNGVEYRGTVYFRRYRADGALFLDGQHAYRWTADNKMQTLSDSARKKLDAYLRPTIEAINTDEDRVTKRQREALESTAHYALADANRAIRKANEALAKARELGSTMEDYPTFDIA